MTTISFTQSITKDGFIAVALSSLDMPAGGFTFSTSFVYTAGSINYANAVFSGSSAVSISASSGNTSGTVNLTGSVTPQTTSPFLTLLFNASGAGTFNADIQSLRINGVTPIYTDPAPYLYNIIVVPVIESVSVNQNVSTAGFYSPLSAFAATTKVSQQAAHGAVTFVSSFFDAPKWTYTPAAGFYGLDTFKLSVSDGFDTRETTIVVNVSPTGTFGNDVFQASAASYVVDGGAGSDTLQYAGSRANVKISTTATGFTITDKTGTTGLNTIRNVETVSFADASVDLTMGARAAAIGPAALKSLEELYVAYFNRVPDSKGLAYWIDAYKGGASLSAIGASFYAAAISPEFSALTGYTPSMSDTNFVGIIYKNVLGRDPDTAGLGYWTKSLATGEQTRASLISTILTAAHTYKGDAQYGFVANLLDNKITVANRIAVEEGLSYAGSVADTYGRYVAISAAVTPTDITAAITLIGTNDASFSLVAS